MRGTGTAMDHSQIIALLARQTGYVSGQEMSQALGVTRGAVWKEISALREQGWPITSSTRLGYRLDGPPPRLSAPYLESQLTGTISAGRIHVLDQVDSTNTRLKAMAAQGAAHGTVVAALEQTAGRGTRGRTFVSPPGGLYLSLLLRPQAELSQLFSLTGWAAVAVRQAVQEACGAPACIKWLNDIYLHNRKLCGILTELSLVGESSEPDYVVVGVGINLTQTAQTFQAMGLGATATSLALEGYPVEPNHMALTLLHALHTMARQFPQCQEEYLQAYTTHCLTLGQRVEVEVGNQTYPATAQSVLPDFSLNVVDDQGTPHTVSSGRVIPLSLLHSNAPREDHP